MQKLAFFFSFSSLVSQRNLLLSCSKSWGRTLWENRGSQHIGYGYLLEENFSTSSEPTQTSFPTCAALLWSSCAFWFDVSDMDPVMGTVMACCSCQLGYIRNHLKPSLFLACSSGLSVRLALDPTSPGPRHRLKTGRSLGVPCRLFMGTG